MKKNNIIAVIPSYKDNSEKYLKRWIKLLNSRTLNKKLKENDAIIYFYGKGKIEFKSDRVVKKRLINISKVDLLITDSTSVKLKYISKVKPVIYYRLDKTNEFNRKMTFGKIVSDDEDLINRIIGYMNMDYKLENYYQKKIRAYLEKA